MTRPITRYGRYGLLLAGIIAAADFASKYVILYVIDLPARQTIAVLPFLDLSMVWNRGISYGWLQADSDTGRWLLVALTAAICAGLTLWLARQHHMLGAMALGAIVGGAAGNLYDRAVYGAVADFLDFHILGQHWYVFNVADASISIGAGLLVIDAFRGHRQTSNTVDRDR